MMQEDFNREIMQENYARVPRMDLFPVAWLNVPMLHLAGTFTKYEKYEHALAGFMAVWLLMSIHKTTLKT